MDVRLPDGTIIRNIPDGTSKEDLRTKLASKGYDVSQLGGAASPQQPPSPTGPPMSKADKFLKGVRDPIDGGAQLLTKMLPPGVVAAGNKANNWLADKTGLVGRLPEGGVDQQVRESELKYEERRMAGGESGFDGWRTLGNIASPVNLGLLAATPAGATMAGRAAFGAVSGAATGATAPVLGKDYWGAKGEQIGMSAALGGALTPALGGLARLVSPNASRNPALDLLKKSGVRPTVGQALGGTANRVEEKLTSVPLVGDMIAGARRGSHSSFESAAINRSLAPIGDKLPKGMSGREAIEYAEQKLAAKYDDVLGKIGAIQPDRQFNSKVHSLTQMVNKSRMPDAEKAKFGMAIDKVSGAIDQHGVITSNAFKTLESDLGSTVRKLSGSQNVYDGEIAPAVKQVQQELRDMLRRQAGSHAFELGSANKGWANFKRAQRAASAVGAENGEFSPAQFQSAVKALDRSKDKGAFARGSALGQDLGDAGKSILGNKVPDSGTPGRLALGAVAGGGAALLEPSLLAGALGGAALYMSPMQRLLVAAASARPAAAKPAAKALRKSAPVLLPGTLQLGLQGLQQK